MWAPRRSYADAAARGGASANGEEAGEAMWNQVKTVVLLGALSALLIGFGALLGQGYLYGFTALALLVNLGAYFFSDRVVLAVSRARALPEAAAPRLHFMVAELAASADLATASLYIVNPFAGLRGLARLFSTHPPMRERVARLRAMARGRLAA